MEAVSQSVRQRIENVTGVIISEEDAFKIETRGVSQQLKEDVMQRKYGVLSHKKR